jgi:hypothetical protein
MASKRIIDLTAAGALALTDVFEIDTGTLSLKVTGQQIYNLIAAQLNAAALLNLASGNIQISANGTFQIFGGQIVLRPDGSADFNAGSCTFNADASLSLQSDLKFPASNLVGPVILSRPSDIAYRITVNDAGVLGTEAA